MQFIRYKFSKLSSAAKVILDLMQEEYSIGPAFVRDTKKYIDNFLKPLHKDINIFIETPYVDKVFRDSYYNYFSTKYRHYDRNCMRLSFFKKRIDFNSILLSENEEILRDNFLGYCILRPTFPHVIGRNLMKREAFIKSDFVTCIHEENVLVNGHKLYVSGFPHSSQDQETITCAETTLWAIMEYFGHKYAEYKPVLPSTILKNLDEHSERRMLPSNGLYNEQISFALKNFGFGTMIYSKEKNPNFFPDLSVFIESGIPVVAILQNADSEANHAILMVGREKSDPDSKLKAFVFRTKSILIPFDSLVTNYVVQDDTRAPYELVSFDKPGSYYDENNKEYIYDITTFVVPLYKKMYMDIKQARKFFEEIFYDEDYGIKDDDRYVFRMYMASSRSFKEHIALQKELDSRLRFTLLTVSFPRFIWCAEFINKADASAGTVSALIVLDATEGDENWKNSFIFAARKKSSIFYRAVDHTYKTNIMRIPFNGFGMYAHNLN